MTNDADSDLAARTVMIGHVLGLVGKAPIRYIHIKAIEVLTVAVRPQIASDTSQKP